MQIMAQTSILPFRKANTILISTNLTGVDAYFKWHGHLIQNGFSIDESDSSLFTLSTVPVNTSKINSDFIVDSRVTDTGIIIITFKWRMKPDLRTLSSETRYFDWDYTSCKNNVRNVIFRDFYPVIVSFGDYEILYDKR